MKNKDLKLALSYILKDSNFKWEPISEFIDNLEDIEIELVKLKVGLGFTHNKIYLDLLECYRQDDYNGHLTLFVLLHEVGHILRLNGDEELRERMETDNFKLFFEDVLIEEKAATNYAINQFKILTGVEVSQAILNTYPNFEIDNYKDRIEGFFLYKEGLGSWDAFIEQLIDRDFKHVITDLSWNTDFTERERMVRASIGGEFGNPFNIPKAAILFNPKTYSAIRVNGESIDDYNEKDIMLMNPFNCRYNGKVSYENGKVVEAYRVEDDQWVSVDLNTL